MSIQLRKILLPTDFSQYSSAAEDYACELAAKFKADLHVLHVIEPHLSATPDFGLGLNLPKYISESKAAAQRCLDRIPDPKSASGISVTRVLLDGATKSEVIRYARNENIDLIVIATHGRTGLSHVIMGSVAESIVRTAPCPVLTVRPEGHQFVMP